MKTKKPIENDPVDFTGFDVEDPQFRWNQLLSSLSNRAKEIQESARAARLATIARVLNKIGPIVILLLSTFIYSSLRAHSILVGLKTAWFVGLLLFTFVISCGPVAFVLVWVYRRESPIAERFVLGTIALVVGVIYAIIPLFILFSFVL